MFIAFVGFQLIGVVIAVALLFVGGQPPSSASAIQAAMLERLDLLFVGNSVGQLLVLGLGSWLVAKVASGSYRREDLRLASTGVFQAYALTVLAVVFIQPLVVFLGWINLQYPFSESYLAFEKAQTDMLERYLRSDHFMPVTLLHVALIPALCEELLMRGFALRYLERSFGIIPGLFLSSVIFGVFHVRFTQFLPLVALGLLLAWITWKSGSIFPAILGHFLNNGANVIMARYAPDFIFNKFTPEQMPPLWMVVMSTLATAGVAYLFHHLARRKNVLSAV
jgi:membrane protease YdiL (CAAX protease family)